MVLAGSKLRFAKVAISARRKPLTRRNFKRLGLPSGVVSTAATIGVFAGRTAAPLAAVALAAEIGVIHLDPSRQALCGIPLHHYLHEFVLDLPGCGLGNTKPAAQLDAGNASLALGQVVHGAKPGAQRHFGRGENRPSDQRCLPSTGGTLVKRAGFDHAVTLPAADRANEAGGPAPAEHLLATLFLGPIKNGKPSLTEALLELDLVARHRSAPQNSHMFVFCTPICWLRIVRNQENLCRSVRDWIDPALCSNGYRSWRSG